jgi:putative oxidoreductase
MNEQSRNKLGWLILRITLAVLIGVHGWFRLFNGGVEPFGIWLNGQGIPFGFWVAAAITTLEIVGSALLVFGRMVRLLCGAFAMLYAMGILMLHAAEGWFVVGAGRNGAEYSVLLIVALFCVGLQHSTKKANYLD